MTLPAVSSKRKRWIWPCHSGVPWQEYKVVARFLQLLLSAIRGKAKPIIKTAPNELGFQICRWYFYYSRLIIGFALTASYRFSCRPRWTPCRKRSIIFYILPNDMIFLVLFSKWKPFAIIAIFAISAKSNWPNFSLLEIRCDFYGSWLNTLLSTEYLVFFMTLRKRRIMIILLLGLQYHFVFHSALSTHTWILSNDSQFLVGFSLVIFCEGIAVWEDCSRCPICPINLNI